MKNTTKTKSLRKGSPCPTCNAGKLIPIVYGLPGRELIEKSGRGEIELEGFVVSQIIDENGIRSNDPELNCPACDSKFFRSGVLDRVQENDQPIGGALGLEGWESSHLSFLIDPLDDGSRLLTVVKKSDCEWIRETLGDEAGSAADMGPIEIDLDAVQDFVDEVVAQKRWVLDYTKLTNW